MTKNIGRPPPGYPHTGPTIPAIFFFMVCALVKDPGNCKYVRLLLFYFIDPGVKFLNRVDMQNLNIILGVSARSAPLVIYYVYSSCIIYGISEMFLKLDAIFRATGIDVSQV